MNQPQPPQNQASNNTHQGNRGGYIVWGIVTIPALYIFLIYTTSLCEKLGFLIFCGDRWAGSVPPILGLVVIGGFWTFISLFIFLVSKNRTLAYVFGGLLIIEIIYVALNIRL